MTQTYDRNTAFIRIYTIKLASSLLDSLSLLLGLVSHVGQGLDVQSMPCEIDDASLQARRSYSNKHRCPIALNHLKTNSSALVSQHMLTKTYKVEGESDASSCDLRKYSFLPRLSLLLLSACIAATYLMSQMSFLEAAMKRPASKLHKAV